MKTKNTFPVHGFFGDSEEPDHDYPGPLLTKFLIPFGALLVAAIALWPNYDKLPGWLILILVSYLLVVAGVSLAYPTKKALTRFFEKRKRKQLAQRYYALLEDRMKAFAELAADNRADGFVYLLQQINNWEELREKRISLTGLAFMRQWMESLQKRLAFHRVDEFSLLAWDFSVILMEYQMFCEQAQQHLQSAIEWSVPDPRRKDFKSKWNIAREDFVHLIKDWQQAAKKINELAGVRVCIDYYTPLRLLE